MKKRIACFALTTLMLSHLNVLAMSTSEFDKGMAKGISYFNRGLYYEAKDEFTWFKNSSYDDMNLGQQKYLDDYMNAANRNIEKWELQCRSQLAQDAHYSDKYNMLRTFIRENGIYEKHTDWYMYKYNKKNIETVLTYKENNGDIAISLFGTLETGSSFVITISLQKSSGTLCIYKDNDVMSSQGYFDSNGRYHTTYTDMPVSYEELDDTMDNAVETINAVLRKLTISTNSRFTVSLSDFNIYY